MHQQHGPLCEGARAWSGQLRLCCPRARPLEGLLRSERDYDRALASSRARRYREGGPLAKPDASQQHCHIRRKLCRKE
eukprot:11174-Heterococcus_DN1.PRE.2